MMDRRGFVGTSAAALAALAVGGAVRGDVVDAVTINQDKQNRTLVVEMFGEKISTEDFTVSVERRCLGVHDVEIEFRTDDGRIGTVHLHTDGEKVERLIGRVAYRTLGLAVDA